MPIDPRKLRPSTKTSLGQLMGDRRDLNYQDPMGKVVAFEVLKNGDVLFGPNLGVAEDYPSSETLEPGDVVRIDDNAKLLTITRAANPYDQRVVGVVATRPAMRISHLESGTPVNADMTPRSDVFPVAHSGRVAVKVSVENGPIRPGDYLTSSSKPGVSMKATTKGAIIGKARTQNRGEFEVDGVVQRKVYSEVPSNVEYLLAEYIRTLRPISEIFCKWKQRHMRRIRINKKYFQET